VRQIFNYYDSNGNGLLEYKEFSGMVCGSIDKPTAPNKANEYGSGIGYQKPTDNTNINELLQKVKTKLASRGARGLIGMGK